MKSKITNQDWFLLALGLVFIIISLSTGSMLAMGWSSGIFLALNVRWYFPPKKIKKDGDIETFTNINRLEVINHSNEGTIGRVFNFRGRGLIVECHLQDGTETLKIFISK